MAGREPDRWWAALLCGLTLLAAREVAAAPTVVLLRVPNGHAAWRAAESRTGDELRAMGLRVEEVRALPTEVPRILQEGAQAVVRIERVNDGARVEIRVADVDAGPRRLALAELPVAGSEAVATAALRAAEQVVVGISQDEDRRSAAPVVVENVESLPLVSASEAASGTNGPPTRTVDIPRPVAGGPALEAAPPPVAVELVAVEDERLAGVPRPVRAPAPRRLRGLGVQAAALAGPGGVGVLGELSLALRVALGRRVTIDPSLLAAVAPAQVKAQGGSIRVGYVAGEVMLGYAPGRGDGRVSPRLGLGGGVAAAWARGQARSPLEGGTDIAALGLISGNAAVAIRVRSRLRLWVGAGIHVLLSPVVVRISGEEVARLGPLVIRGSVGLEWDWPRG